MMVVSVHTYGQTVNQSSPKLHDTLVLAIKEQTKITLEQYTPMKYGGINFGSDDIASGS
jgi:hypothetical protein